MADDARGTRGHQCPRTDDHPHHADHPGKGRCRGDAGVRASSTTVEYVPGELLVRFHPTATEAERQEAVERAGGVLTESLTALGLHVVAVAPSRTHEARESLRHSAAVAEVEQDVYVEAVDTTPGDPLWPTQWGWRVVGAPRAWDATRGSPDVVVAVVDSGVDAHHPDLVGATTPGYDFVNGDPDPADDEGHGTSAAGVIAARGDNGLGLAGVCWHCRVMPVKVLDENGAGKTSTIAAGIVWAVDRGARVVNLSLGGPGTTSALEGAVQYASGKGAVLVAAAGNSGTDTRFYPAAYEQTISVAATTESDALYGWSSFGPWVKFAAPGCNTAPGRDDGYVQFCGTSSAAPLVSGIAALALSQKPALSRRELEQAITDGAAQIGSGVRYGRVSAIDTVGAVPAGNSTPLPPAQPATTPAPTEAPSAAPPSVDPSQPAVPDAAVPASASRPRLRGLARIGRSLRVTAGSWQFGPVLLAYRWRHCAPSGRRCVVVAGARGSRLVLTRRLRGRRVQALVTASNGAGSATVSTGMSSLVRPRA